MPEITEVVDDAPATENGKVDVESSLEDVTRLKDRGNEQFKIGELKEALSTYSEAIKMANKLTLPANNRETLAILYCNRAAVYMKLEYFQRASDDCTKALSFSESDVKALYRRAQAEEQLQRFGSAFTDAKLALRFDPTNTAVQQMCRRLMEKNQKMLAEQNSTNNRVNEMLKVAFEQDGSSQWTQTEEKRIQALNNLIVLARESDAGAELIWQRDLVEKLLDLVEKEQQLEVVQAAIRVLDELAKQQHRAWSLCEHLGWRRICRLMSCRQPSWTELVDSASAFVQRFFNVVADMDRAKGKKADPDTCDKNKLEIIRLIIELEDMLTDPEVHAPAREAVVDLLLKNIMHMDGGLSRGWSWRFVDERGLLKLLDVACQVPELCAYPVTVETRQHIAICLTRLYEDMVFDTKRTIYKERCDTFINEKMTKSSDLTERVRICSCITTLLQGPLDIGFGLATNSAVTDLMLRMASADDVLHQKVAAELIVQVSGKRDRATEIIAKGTPILKKLYESKNDGVKARALMGLCKIASAGGDDASRATMAEGTTLKLATACRKFICGKNDNADRSKITKVQSTEMRHFALEGLAYLTLDADVKEWFIDDIQLVKAVVQLAKDAGALCVYAMASIFVNVINAYDKAKVDPEMVKLAQFAKHHIPEEHEMDKEEYVKTRVDVLVKNQATSACIAVSKTESHQCMELLARCLSKFSLEKDHRGIVVKEGGAKLLLKLSLEGTEDGRAHAAQGLARIGISMDPELAFPGQRMYEMVRPMLDLLHVEREGLQNYEALLTLTNLASVSDSVRKRIISEKGVPKIEEYWFMQDHDELRAAAAELLLNLLHCEEGRKFALDPNTDRLKLWLLYAGYDEEDDSRLLMSAASALAILTEDTDVCKRIPTLAESWPEVLRDMCMREDEELQYRGMLAVANILESDKDVCAKAMQTQLFEVLLCVCKLKEKGRSKARELAERCLKAAETWGLIKATAREQFERQHQVSTIKEEAT